MSTQTQTITHRAAMTGAAGFWYIVMCICLGAGYLAKVPAKKALKDKGIITSLTAAESFWYVVLCIWFGAGYFSKVITAKALDEAL